MVYKRLGVIAVLVSACSSGQVNAHRDADSFTPSDEQGVTVDEDPSDTLTPSDSFAGGDDETPSDEDTGGDSGVASDEDLPSGTIPIIVGLGWTGVRVLSIDEGITWCETGLMEDDHDDLFRGGTFHNGVFYGAHAGRSNEGAIIISRNGYTWTPLHRTNDAETDGLSDFPTGQWLGGIAYGNGVWLASGGCGYLGRSQSADGLTGWQRFGDVRPAGGSGCKHVRSLAFGNGVFVAGTGPSSYGWVESVDGSTWTVRDPNGGNNVHFQEGQFEAYSTPTVPDRGICLKPNGNAVQRSTSTDCTNMTQHGNFSDSLTTILFGYAPAADFAPQVVPSNLATCLNL